MTDDLTTALRRGPMADAGVLAAAEREARAAAVRRADADGLVEVALAFADTPIGRLSLAATPGGLVRVGFPREEGTIAEELAEQVSPRVVEHPARLDEVRRELDEYFDGRRQVFDVAVDLRLARGFRRQVLELLFARVGYGHTASYAELAQLVGSPRASRAVGTAMATNPVPIVVPCHRVLRTGGALGGYGGGLDVKRYLLALEGATSNGAQPSLPLA